MMRHIAPPGRREAAVHHQAADWTSPVSAARTASSRSASVKPRCRCSRATTRSRKMPRLSNGRRSAAAHGAKLRIGEGDHAAMVLPARWMSIVITLRPLIPHHTHLAWHPSTAMREGWSSYDWSELTKAARAKGKVASQNFYEVPKGARSKFLNF